ncbi:MAG: M48 family metalloprotease [Vicinamibacterales bacterium]|nr:M48 family metalloprotease [Vicinamibacterales bacterium]
MSEWFARPFGVQLKPDGFAAMTVPDWRWLNGQRYEFKFLRREFLGEVRCLVLDVQPRVDSRDGFTGRIWVEDGDFNIVRFNGITRSPGRTLGGKRYWFNVDSWRVSVFPGMWLPSYVYAELGSDDPREGPRIKSQVRLWGYDLKSVRPMQELTTIQIGDAAVRDGTEQPQQLSPTMSQRMWDQQAEENVLERLAKAGLLAPPGEVDKVLETVVRNLQITNNLPIDPGVRARVLLTSPLESFTVGHTIVLSRGLIDVLPDEASLATMLAHELAHIVLGHRVIDSKFAFADKLMVPDDELLVTVRYQHSLREEEAADAQVIELLKKSPYKDKLADAGLFLRLVAENSQKLKNLIQPHIGEHTGDEGQLLRLTELIQKSPALSAESVDQIAALPLGGRVTVDPWSSRVELLKTPTVPLASAREKSSLAVTPLMPYLRYAKPRS